MFLFPFLFLSPLSLPSPFPQSCVSSSSSADSFFRKEPLPDKPIKSALPGEVKIPLKPKKSPATEANGQSGHGPASGGQQSQTTAEVTIPAKRPHPEGPEDASAAKRAKSAAAPSADKDSDVVVIDDGAEAGAAAGGSGSGGAGRGGAIVIDDD